MKTLTTLCKQTINIHFRFHYAAQETKKNQEIVSCYEDRILDGCSDFENDGYRFVFTFFSYLVGSEQDFQFHFVYT